MTILDELRPLRPDQERRVWQMCQSWGYGKRWHKVRVIRRAIRKVLRDWP